VLPPRLNATYLVLHSSKSLAVSISVSLEQARGYTERRPTTLPADLRRAVLRFLAKPSLLASLWSPTTGITRYLWNSITLKGLSSLWVFGLSYPGGRNRQD